MKKLVFPFLFICMLCSFPSQAGVKSMKKKQDRVRYQASPNPIETKGDRVMIQINGSIGPKFFRKKAIMVLQPVLQWEGGSIDLTPIVLKGEKVKGDAPNIPFKKGGRFSFSDTLDFQKGMENAKIIVNPVVYQASKTTESVKFRTDALKQKGAIELGNLTIAEKINITSTRISSKGDISIAPHSYKKNEGVNLSSTVYFPVNLAKIDWNFSINKQQKSKEELETLKDFMLANGVSKQINIIGWASPEGEERFNIGLSKKRAESTVNLVNEIVDEVLREKAELEEISKSDIDYYLAMAKKDIVITTAAQGEDWDNFIKLLEQSSISERNSISNVVKSQSDKKKRESEIRSMATVFKEISTQVLPSLRRSQISFIYNIPKKTDPEIGKLAALSPDKLSFDELMYAAALNYNYAAKYKIYKWATENFTAEWTAWNNAAATAFYLGNTSEAERFLNVAKELSPESPEVLNNLALLFIDKGDYEVAQNLLEKSNEAQNAEAKQNIAILLLKKGEYEDANKILEEKECSYNLGLSKLLSGNTGVAIKTLDCCIQQTAEVLYLKAVAYARLDDMQAAFDNLKQACEQDDSYKNTAEKDVEFKKYWGQEEFRNIVK